MPEECFMLLLEPLPLTEEHHLVQVGLHYKLLMY